MKKITFGILTVFAMVLLTVSAFSQSMTQRWTTTAGTLLNGGLAYSARSGTAHLYLVSDGTTTGKISILRASTGAASSPANLVWPTAAMSLGTGIPSGTYYTRGLCNDSDGYVYGCNYVAAGTGATQYILKWDPANESANPTVLWSKTDTSTGGGSGSMGPSLAVYGTGNNAVFVIGTTSTTTTTGGFIVYNNGTTWTSKYYKLGVSGPAATADQTGLTFIDFNSGTGVYRFYSKFSGTSGYVNEFTTSATSPIALTQTIAGGTTTSDPLVFATSGAINIAYDPNTGLICGATRINATVPPHYTNFLAATFGGPGTNIYGSAFLQQDDVTTTTSAADGANAGGAVWGGGAMFVTESVSVAGPAAGVVTAYDITAFKLQSGSDPTSLAKNYGQSAIYTVKSGGSTLTYQWKKDGVNLSNGSKYTGVTTTNLTVLNVNASDSATASGDGSTGYACTVSGVSASTWTSAGAALTVTDPVISVNPQNVTAPINGAASFTVTAAGSATLQYQWRKGGVNLSNGDQGDGVIVANATTSALTLSGVTSTYNTSSYDCVVSSSAVGTGTQTSSSATLTVKDPAITTDTTPASQSVSTGGSATFSIVAAGSGTLTYQWYQNPGNVLLSNSGDFNGVTTATLTISPAAKVDAASYYCVVSETGAPNTPQTSTPAALAVLDPPGITTGPSSTTVTKLQNANFTVVATGDSITYQWKKGGVSLSNGAQGSGSTVSGATTSTLTVSSVRSGDVGSYTVVVHNGVGADVTSGAGTLSIQYTLTLNTAGDGLATIVATPTKAAYASGEVVSVTATAGTANYSLDYWQGTGTGATTTIQGRGQLASTNISITMNDNIAETANFALPNIVVDNLDTSGTDALGLFIGNPDDTATYWAKGLNSTIPFFGTDYQYATPTGVQGTPTVVGTFAPNIPIAGMYDVYICFNNGANRGSDVPYRVLALNGTTTVRVNQQNTLVGGAGNVSVGSGLFTNITSKYFNVGTNFNVQVGNDCNGSVAIVDAVWFKYSATQVTPIAITTQPASSTALNAGDVLHLSVVATGTSPKYQWKRNGGNLANATLGDGAVIAGAKTANLTVTGLLGDEAGTYTCLVTNAANSVLSSDADVSVTDPYITVQPPSVTAECGSAATTTVIASGTGLTYQWYTPDANGTAVIDATNATLSASAHGTVAYVCVVTSSFGAATSSSATITGQDTAAPVVTLNGAADVTVECHGSFSDPGASVADTCDGASTVSVPTSGTADLNTVGTYVVTYTASDTSSNLGNSVTRTIHVTDTQAPSVTLNGSSTMIVECHTTFSDPGATASDSCDASPNVTTSGSVSTNTPGIYILTYTAVDASGNSGTVSRQVTVSDTAGPVITLTGAASMTVECHGSFTDPGAAALDACDGSSSLSTSGSVDPDTLGVYTLTYSSTDTGSNSTTVYRTVTVSDSVAPVITVNSGPNTLCIGDAYTDPGATANDACVGSVSVNTAGLVNSSVAGNYTLTYTATDPSNNSSTATRVVQVIACITSDPFITVQPANVIAATGSNVVFSITAVGTGPLKYQWFFIKNGTTTPKKMVHSAVIPAVTNDTLSINKVSGAASGGSYYCVVSNALHSITNSANATLTVHDAPVVKIIPPFKTLLAGYDFKMVAKVTKGAVGQTVSYQWKKAGSAISDATNSTYSLVNVQTNDGAIYTCVVNNDSPTVGSNSCPLTVTQDTDVPKVVLLKKPTDASAKPGLKPGDTPADATGTNQAPNIDFLGEAVDKGLIVSAYLSNAVNNATFPVTFVKKPSDYTATNTSAGKPAFFLSRVSLVDGTNIFYGVATDSDGNATVSKATHLFYISNPQALTIATSGTGHVTSVADLSYKNFGTPANGAVLAVGHNYTIKATATGHLVTFGQWVLSDPSALISTNATSATINSLTFQMKTNLSITAKFSNAP